MRCIAPTKHLMLWVRGTLGRLHNVGVRGQIVAPQVPFFSLAFNLIFELIHHSPLQWQDSGIALSLARQPISFSLFDESSMPTGDYTPLPASVSRAMVAVICAVPWGLLR